VQRAVATAEIAQEVAALMALDRPPTLASGQIEHAAGTRHAQPARHAPHRRDARDELTKQLCGFAQRNFQEFDDSTESTSIQAK